MLVMESRSKRFGDGRRCLDLFLKSDGWVGREERCIIRRSLKLVIEDGGDNLCVSYSYVNALKRGLAPIL